MPIWRWAPRELFWCLSPGGGGHQGLAAQNCSAVPSTHWCQGLTAPPSLSLPTSGQCCSGAEPLPGRPLSALGGARAAAPHPAGLLSPCLPGRGCCLPSRPPKAQLRPPQGPDPEPPTLGIPSGFCTSLSSPLPLPCGSSRVPSCGLGKGLGWGGGVPSLGHPAQALPCLEPKQLLPAEGCPWGPACPSAPHSVHAPSPSAPRRGQTPPRLTAPRGCLPPYPEVLHSLPHILP